jgi:hypothetical protein
MFYIVDHAADYSQRQYPYKPLGSGYKPEPARAGKQT